MIQLLLSLIFYISICSSAPLIIKTVVVTAPMEYVTVTVGYTPSPTSTQIPTTPETILVQPTSLNLFDAIQSVQSEFFNSKSRYSVVLETVTAPISSQYQSSTTTNPSTSTPSSSFSTSTLQPIPSSSSINLQIVSPSLSSIYTFSTSTTSSLITSSSASSSSASSSSPSSSSPSSSSPSSSSPPPTETSQSNPILSKVVSSTPQSGYSYMSTINRLWQRFWQNGKWNQNDVICENASYVTPPLWSLAVLGKAITNTGDSSGINTVINSILDYHDQATGAFSDQPKTGTFYTDDNAQLMWVFTDAYKITNNQQYLTCAEGIMNYLKTQNFENTGGIVWQNDQNYIASISTVETALAAVRLYEVNGDESLIDLANKCMKFMFDHFQDPNDKLFYDGLDKTAFASVNKGKLSYTVGCAISTLSKLYKLKNDISALTKALELATAATNINGAFYTGEKIWNNSLQYSHLLFAGFGDAFQSSSQFDQFKPEVTRQANYIYQFLQDPSDSNLYFDSINVGTTNTFNKFAQTFQVDSNYTPSTSIYCNNNPNGPTSKSFLTNASAAQILYQLAKY
ncbi:FAV3 [Candida jiufengensis]|uniref:FAV3 n=1 Tax=Candida jiufengensis TaxID=497108 RepID=UPI0022242253|nr:FAV3 [Candida jiufengensis]KAI5951987.1 FAV3 [Candida jiufengensis]